MKYLWQELLLGLFLQVQKQWEIKFKGGCSQGCTEMPNTRPASGEGDPLMKRQACTVYLQYMSWMELVL